MPLRSLLFAVLLALALPARAEQYDVLIYGGTPAGIAAAVAAAESGEKVLLVEPYSYVGGLMSNGLSHPDFRTFEGLSGPFWKLRERVRQHYAPEYGPRTDEVTLRGTQAEPKVFRQLFEQWLGESGRITVRTGWALEAVRCSTEAEGDQVGSMRAVEMALLMDLQGERHAVAAQFFIDASYEGDLMAAVGVPYSVGRESCETFSEDLAPEVADNQLQAYNFRLCLTRDPALRVPFQAPPGYTREEFAGVLPLLAEGSKITAVFGTKPYALMKAHEPALPHGKYDLNDMSKGALRLSLPGANDLWPDGGGGVAIRDGATPGLQQPPFSRTALAQARARVQAEHVRWQVGLLYFLQNDDAVPAKYRAEAREWGWPKDEFTATGHVPEQLYVREARRMQGLQVFTQKHTDYAPGDARAVLQRDAIAMGDYGPNCHGTEHVGPRTGGEHRGEFYRNVPPYQIPYGTLVPAGVENLLVVGAVSSSHVGFCALRLEPIWMSLGEAAGVAAHLLHRRGGLPVQKLPVAELQRRLHQRGQATLYLSDVPPDHPHFAAAQWWGLQGGFHGLAPAPPKPGQRGKNIIGQYFEAFPGHAAELDAPFAGPVAQRWTALAKELALTTPAPAAGQTRGQWLQAVYEAAK